MPSFYGHSMAAAQMPLTPPDSGSGFGYSNMHYAQDPYSSHQSMPQARYDDTCSYQQAYMQPPVAQSAASSYSYPQTSYQPANILPPIQSFHAPMGAPIIPPIQIQDTHSFTDDFQRRLQQQQQNTAAREQRQAPKEDKPTGGVSAKLDYDMERMTDFVTERTMSMYAYHNSSICLADIDITRSFTRSSQHGMQGQPAFRKWVHQVLSATRLPSATILLSLHFLNDRIENHRDSVMPGENSMYRLLAVSLILGSKFLDDNTFINRSWSDVTSIKVGELNLLEMKWLQLIGYSLHVDPHAPRGLQAWLDSWKEHDRKYVVQQQQPARLSPLNTNVLRSSAGRDRFSPYPSPFSGTTTRSYGTPTTARSSQYGPSPYMNGDSWGQNTQGFDDFYKRQRKHPTLSEFDDVKSIQERNRRSMYGYQQAAYPSYYQSPNYGSAWDQHAWGSAHRYDCGCATCVHQWRPYSTASSYVAQSVMG